MTNKRTFFVGLVLVCVALAYPYVRSMAVEPQGSSVQQNTGPVLFGHPEHAAFFKYQIYLTAHKKDGTTPEKWNALPPQKQQEMLAAGETMLKALHKELLAKPQLNAEETELFQAVWGKDDKPAAAEIPVSTDAAAKAKPVNNEKVEAIFSSVESSKKAGSWGELFDGGGSRSEGAVSVTAATPADARAEKAIARSANGSKTSTPPALGTVPVPATDNAPASDGNGGSTGGKTLPITIGAVLLAGIYFGAKAFSGKGRAPAGEAADSDFASLKAATRQDARAAGTPTCGETCGCQTTYGPCGSTCSCTKTCGCTATCGSTCGDTCSCTKTCGCQTTYGPCDCTATCGCTATSCGSTCTCTGTCGCQTTYGPK